MTVFWPGHQPVFSGEFDLLQVGDDVVFGSRSIILTSTTTGFESVVLSAGSNVSDNCVVLPGSVLGKSATLGSNSVCPRGKQLPDNSVWFGSKSGEPTCLDPGSGKTTVSLQGDESTIRPFGRAFYQGKASYYVWPLSWIVAASLVLKILIATFHSLPLLASFHGAALILYGTSANRFELAPYTDFASIYRHVMEVFVVANILRVGVWLAIELVAKWTLLGRRQPGTYNYDETSYGQRWELYQLICKVRKFSRFNFLQFFYGTPYMSWYFRWNGGVIGENVCLYPSGADPFMPEPDLTTIGKGCVIDCASLVCHLNTRGNFDLAPIVLQDNCTLQCRSRAQQGVVVETGSQLMAKSVAMTGEVLEACSVWVGCPATWWFQRSGSESNTNGSSEILDFNSDETTGLLAIAPTVSSQSYTYRSV